MRLSKLLIIVLLNSLFSFSCSQQAIEWEGTIEEIHGVTVVKNPEDPIYNAESFEMIEELSIGEREGREEYMFQRLFTLAVNANEDIYVLDYQANHIRKFDKEGEYISTIGKSGQGPGELEAPRSLFCSDQGELVVGDINRVSYFTLDGEFLRSTAYKGGMIVIRDMDSEGNFYAFDIVGAENVYEVKKFDPEFNHIASFGTSPLPNPNQNNPFFSLLRFGIIQGTRIVFGYAEEGYVLEIKDTSGNLIRKIEKKYTPLEPTQEDVEEQTADDPPEMKRKLSVPKYFPPFRTMMADDEGRIYVYTYERTPDREKSFFDIFDAEGKYIFKVPFKSRPHVIKKNNIYTIEEDEDGYQYVKRCKVTWNY
jgi:hypothetical protein